MRSDGNAGSGVGATGSDGDAASGVGVRVVKGVVVDLRGHAGSSGGGGGQRSMDLDLWEGGLWAMLNSLRSVVKGVCEVRSVDFGQ